MRNRINKCMMSVTNNHTINFQTPEEIERNKRRAKFERDYKNKQSLKKIANTPELIEFASSLEQQIAKFREKRNH